MKPVLLLVHGWGFDASFWAPLQAALPPGDSLAWDLGFFGPATQPPLLKDRPVMAVGHSFGLLWLLHHRPVPWRALVSINGFSCFTRRETFPEGCAPRLVQRMIAQFGKMPEQVVADFRARCGSRIPLPAARDPARLLDGLQALADWDERCGQVQFALCGRADPLVPVAMSQACFPAQNIAWHNGGHLLPQEDPVWCAAQLLTLTRNFA
jgi:pimeloyl-[acyl-carrier protein] methyl ester esterase